MMRTTTPILSILIAISLFVFFTHPEYLKTKEIQEDIKNYESATQKYQEFSGRLQEKLDKKVARSAYELERLERFVPSEIDETRHLVDLETLAKKNNLLFGNTQVENRRPTISTQTEEVQAAGDDLITSDISFDVVGTYTQFKNFLQDLEQSLSLYEVTSISFSVIDGPFQQFSVSVRTYALSKDN